MNCCLYTWFIYPCCCCHNDCGLFYYLDLLELNGWIAVYMKLVVLSPFLSTPLLLPLHLFTCSLLNGQCRVVIYLYTCSFFMHKNRFSALALFFWIDKWPVMNCSIRTDYLHLFIFLSILLFAPVVAQ